MNVPGFMNGEPAGQRRMDTGDLPEEKKGTSLTAEEAKCVERIKCEGLLCDNVAS